MKVTWPATPDFVEIDLSSEGRETIASERLVSLLKGTDSEAAWIVLDAGRAVGWLAARTVPLRGRSAGAARAELRVPDPIGTVDESMIPTASGSALRLVQRHALDVAPVDHPGAKLLGVHASWSWSVEDNLIVLSTSSAEPALAALTIDHVDALAAKIVIDA